MAFFFDLGADPRNPFNQGPTLSHQALQEIPYAPPRATSVNHEEDVLDQLSAQLNDLTLLAEEIVAQQPRTTQVRLMLETRKMFNAYKKSGSMIRLEKNVDQFLKAGDSDGLLTFKAVPNPESKGLPVPSNQEPAHYGRAFRHNFSSADDVYEHAVLPNDRRNPGPAIGLQSLHPLRIIDPNSISYVTTLPWDPVGTLLQWPEGLDLPHGLLGKLNQILSIVDYDCRVRLFHHVCKYGPSPVLRVGIEAQVQSHYSSMIESRTKNYLGMTPETRVFLRNMFEKKPALNLAESRLLARVCRLSVDTINLLWDDLTQSRRAHLAMKVFITAREIERARRLRHREHQEYLQEQRDKKVKELERRKQLEVEQQLKMRHRHVHVGPSSVGVPKGPNAFADRDPQRRRGLGA
ncbi:hypothetical protein LTR84_007797 [Exophiala bonariae]|uniref:Uncharacterized protein n=1 Tax=Exophiala bonariae TaxID=1690606 RepID=A0AAV9NLF5_9EURO|nr:hypothetical protein LTR84_007797 [Exophiala bonariae]